MSSLLVERMTLDDIEEVRRIELASFDRTWPEAAFKTELQQNRSACYLVLREEGRLCGYTGVWLVEDEAHLTSIAIHPDHRGRGFGKLLLHALLVRCRALGARWVTLEVRADNGAALSLYRKFGFARVGVRERYYDHDQDAVVMWAGNLQSQSYTRRLERIGNELA